MSCGVKNDSERYEMPYGLEFIVGLLRLSFVFDYLLACGLEEHSYQS